MSLLLHMTVINLLIVLLCSQCAAVRIVSGVRILRFILIVVFVGVMLSVDDPCVTVIGLTSVLDLKRFSQDFAFRSKLSTDVKCATKNLDLRKFSAEKG